MSSCWFPPERADGEVPPGAPDVVLAHDPLGVGAGRPAVDARAPRRRRARLVTEDPVLPQRGVEQHALPAPVLGDEADAGLAPGACPPVRDVLGRPGDRARRERPEPHIASTSSACRCPRRRRCRRPRRPRTVRLTSSTSGGRPGSAREAADAQHGGRARSRCGSRARAAPMPTIISASGLASSSRPRADRGAARMTVIESATRGPRRACAR